MNKPILKVYPSKYWHDCVTIIGSKEGLTRLKKVIEAALSGETGSSMVEEVDGCAYPIWCKMEDGDVLDGTYLSLPDHYDDGDDITPEEKEFLTKFLIAEKCEKIE